MVTILANSQSSQLQVLECRNKSLILLQAMWERVNRTQLLAERLQLVKANVSQCLLAGRPSQMVKRTTRISPSAAGLSAAPPVTNESYDSATTSNGQTMWTTFSCAISIRRSTGWGKVSCQRRATHATLASASTSPSTRLVSGLTSFSTWGGIAEVTDWSR